MDPIMKMWMFYNWMEDYKDDYQMLENHGYLVGSFINPEAVKKILGHGVKTHASTDEEFEEASKKLIERNRAEDEDKKPRRKRKRKLQG
jgi:hypothetical protein